MQPGQSLYSIIQFRPNEARAEGVNVGVAVACPTKSVVKAKFSTNNEAVKRRFGASGFDDDRLTSAKRAIQNRLERIEPTEVALRTFVTQEAGVLFLLDPRPIVITELDAELDSLFRELVDELQPNRRSHRRLSKPQLGQAFAALEKDGIPITRNVTVTLPGLPSELEFPFAFQNGVRNLIKPQGFAIKTDEAFKEAKELAADGQLLAKHPDSNGGRNKLIVVGAIEDRELVSGLKNLFNDFGAQLFVVDEVPSLMEDIRKTAH